MRTSVSLALLGFLVVLGDAASFSRYHSEDFSTDREYLITLGKKAAPCAAVGVFCFLVYIIWACGRCCECCKPYDSIGSRSKAFMITLLFALIICGGVFLYLGFEANRKQSKAFTDVTDGVSDMVDWMTLIADFETLLGADANMITARVGQSDCQSSGANFNSLTTAANQISTLSNTVSGKASSANIGSIKEQFSNKVSDIDKIRKIVGLAVLGTLAAVLLVQAIIAFANACQSAKHRPDRNCCVKFLIFQFTFIALWVMLAVWIAAGVFFFMASLAADFCADPTNNLLKQTNLQNQNVVVYYFTCNLPNPPPNPFQSDIHSLTTQLSNVQSQMASLQSSHPTDPCILALVPMVNTLVAHTDDNTGILSLLGCSSLNSVYLQLQDAMCDELGPSLASFFEVFVVLACCITLAEFLKRKLQLRPKNGRVRPYPVHMPTSMPGENPYGPYGGNAVAMQWGHENLNYDTRAYQAFAGNNARSVSDSNL